MTSVTTPQQILQSPLNNSTAKYHWSFGKANRFHVGKAYCETYYNLPSTKSRRSASFGSGKRSSFILTIDSPSPLLYDTRKTFRDTVQGTSFGKNRQQCKAESYIPAEAFKNPGPGAYKEHRPKGLRYSLRPRTAYPSTYFLNDREKTLTPGPGTYEETLKIDPKGYASSRVPNPQRTTLSLKEDRFHGNDTVSPGPGYYNDRNTMNKSGHYMLSTNRSDGQRPFLQDKRELRLDGNRYTPGPGYYRMPSDFGHYEKQNLETIDANAKSVRSKRPMTARK